MDMRMNIETIKKLIKSNVFLLSQLLIILNILFIVLIISLGVDIFNKVRVESDNIISVSATGEAYASPDLALTTFSVVTEAETVDSAISQNAEKMNAVIDYVKSQGVQDKDLKTTSFNIYPRYEWYEKGTCIPPCPSGRRVLVGYEVRQSLQVKIRDLQNIGQIIQGATDKGVNQVSDLQFTIDNQDELKNQARAQAVEKAKAKAKTLASQLEVKLVRITSFSESAAFPRYYALEESMAKGGEAPQIETGENKIEVTISITYEID